MRIWAKKSMKKPPFSRHIETGKMAPNNLLASKLEHMLENPVAGSYS